jgi:hypothetical protein
MNTTSKTTKRTLIGRGKGYVNAAGPQSRFIIFLIFVLIGYTLLLRVFLKLAEFVQLPLFLPISLITLLLFIGVAGTVYSHAFVGPMARIRRAVDQLTRGDYTVSLRLRESDDPMLKELVDSISRLNEHSRNSHAFLNASALELFEQISDLAAGIEKGGDKTAILKRVEAVRKKQEILAKAIQALGKS